MTFFGEENFRLYAPYFVPLLNLLFPRANGEHLKIYRRVARKLCHFFGYAVLALLASIVFYDSSLILAARFWHVCALALVSTIAAADEIRQSFSPERVGSLPMSRSTARAGCPRFFVPAVRRRRAV